MNVLLFKRFWNSLLTTNSTLLREIGRADLRLANKKSSWSYQVLTALNESPNAQQFSEALHARETVNMDVFEKVLSLLETPPPYGCRKGSVWGPWKGSVKLTDGSLTDPL